MNLKKIQDASVDGKKILVRFDTDVPLSDRGEILDVTRLTAAAETTEYLFSRKATIIICGHLGRPKGKVDPSMSLEPVAKWFATTYTNGNCEKTSLGEFSGWKLSDTLYVIENLRFFEGEETNDADFSQKLSQL